jgi:2-amino-4-hydroxy-6-hydroxymethyldihydropteridine diphosphokinase
LIAVKTVYLSLGSNLGDRAQHLREALQALPSDRLAVVRISPVYETAPVDKLDQPDFLNLAAEIETTLFPMQLLRRAQRIERDLGRRRLIDKGPRTIDIDILLYGDFVIQTPQLIVPHPRMHLRRFVLEPMAELAPDLRHPVLGRTMSELRAAVLRQTVRRLTGAL